MLKKLLSIVLILFYLHHCKASLDSKKKFEESLKTLEESIFNNKKFIKDDDCDAECELKKHYQPYWKPNRDWALDKRWTINSNWMGLHKDLLQNIRIRDLIIPGTHDTGTYSIDKNKIDEEKYLSHDSQVLNIYTQLHWGSRYIDARYGCFNEKNENLNSKAVPNQPDSVYIYHASVRADQSWQSFMEEIGRFLEDNPDEIIVLKCQAELEHRCFDNQKVFLFEIIEKTFGNRLINMQDVQTWFNMETVTVNDLFQKNKRVIYYQDIETFKPWDDSLVIKKLNESTLPDKDKYMIRQDWLIDSWMNTNNPEILYERARKDYELNKAEETKMHNNQHQLTPQDDSQHPKKSNYIPDILNIFEFKKTDNNQRDGDVDNSCNSLRYLQGLMVVTKSLNYFEKEAVQNYRYNINIVDHLQYEPQLFRFLLASNLDKKIVLKQVLLNDQKLDLDLFLDKITKVKQQGIIKQNSLYLPNFWKDTGIKKTDQKSVVFIIYSFTDQQRKVTKINAFDPDTQEIYAGFYREFQDDELKTPENLLKVFYGAYDVTNDFAQQIIHNELGDQNPIYANNFIATLKNIKTDQTLRIACRNNRNQGEGGVIIKRLNLSDQIIC